MCTSNSTTGTDGQPVGVVPCLAQSHFGDRIPALASWLALSAGNQRILCQKLRMELPLSVLDASFPRETVSTMPLEPGACQRCWRPRGNAGHGVSRDGGRCPGSATMHRETPGQPLALRDRMTALRRMMSGLESGRRSRVSRASQWRSQMAGDAPARDHPVPLAWSASCRERRRACIRTRNAGRRA